MAFVAIGLFVTILYLDSVVLKLPLFAEDTHPLFSGAYLLRTAALVLAAGLIFASILRQRQDSSRATPELSWIETDLRWGVLAIPLFCLFLFLLDARQFYRLGREDRFVEWASAFLLFGASGTFLWLAISLVHARRIFRKPLILASVGLAGLFFLIGMEEVSWLQRVLGLETPEAIGQLTKRAELNLHNLHTALSENLYYFWAFLLFLVIPFLHQQTSILRRIRGLSVLVPARTVVFAVAPAFAFNYDMWNVAFIQLAFWFTLLVLASFVWDAWTQRSASASERFLLLGLFVSFVSCQVLFIYFGERFVRIWDVTEYKELIIALGCFLYALLVARQIRTTDRAAFSASVLSSPYAVILGLFLLLSLNFVLTDNLLGNELDDLMMAKQFAQPDYMPGDLVLNPPRTYQTGFLMLLYPLVQVLPLAGVSIVGRLAALLLLSIGLGLVAHRIGLNALGATVAMGVYLIFGQDLLPGSDEILEDFGAASISYGFLFLALNALLSRKVLLSAFFAGSATTFHVLTGGWGSLALALAMLSERIGTWRERFFALTLWLVAASVALYETIAFLWEPSFDLPLDVSWIHVYFRNPEGLVPSFWSFEWTEILLIACLVWMVSTIRSYYPDRDQPVVVARFTIWSLLPFLCGLLAVLFSFAPKLLQTHPFRVGSTLLPLLGSMLGVEMGIRLFLQRKPRPWLVAGAAILFFWFAASAFVDGFRELNNFPKGARWGTETSARSLHDVCGWIQEHTEEGAVIITSPRRDPVQYLCGRPVAVRFRSMPKYQAGIAQWYRRLVDFNGGVEPSRRGSRGNREIEANFQKLSARQYQDLGQKYGGKYLLLRQRQRGNLRLRRLYQNRRYAVFALSSHNNRTRATPEQSSQPD